jgi:hypothetical protein
MLIPYGTLVNVAAVLVGGGIGLVMGARLPKAVREVVFQALGLATLALGVKMATGFDNALVLIFSVVIGGIIGAAIGLEDFLASLGDRLKAVVKSDNDHFTHGLLSAFLLFCIGSLTILGSFEEGLKGDPTLLYTKSLLDGFASIALASTYGMGVLFSVIPLFIFQYGLTLGASQLQGVFSPATMAELSATGGLLILGISINLLGLATIRLGDLLPSLAVVVVLASLV